MKRILLAASLLVTGLAGVAAADPAPRAFLAEVSADPRDGADLIDLHHARASHLEIRAENAAIDLRSITLHMSNGRDYLVPGSLRLRAGERSMFALPCRTRCTVDAVTLDYGTQRFDRTPARAEIFAVDETGEEPCERAPSYSTARPYDSYRVRAPDRDSALYATTDWRWRARVR